MYIAAGLTSNDNPILRGENRHTFIHENLY